MTADTDQGQSMMQISLGEAFITFLMFYAIVIPPLVWVHGYKTGMKDMGYRGFEIRKPIHTDPENVMETDPWNQAVYGPTEEEKKHRLPTVKGEVS